MDYSKEKLSQRSIGKLGYLYIQTYEKYWIMQGKRTADKMRKSLETDLQTITEVLAEKQGEKDSDGRITIFRKIQDTLKHAQERHDEVKTELYHDMLQHFGSRIL